MKPSQVRFPWRSAHLSSWKCPCLNLSPLCLDALWMFARFTRRVTNGWTRLSYKRRVKKKTFLYSCYFLLCEVFWQKKKKCFLCSPSRGCDAETLKENTEPVCLTVWMLIEKWGEEKKRHFCPVGIFRQGASSVGWAFCSKMFGLFWSVWAFHAGQTCTLFHSSFWTTH